MINIYGNHYIIRKSRKINLKGQDSEKKIGRKGL